jgi:phosphohistidine swiveling domain-containing protein
MRWEEYARKVGEAAKIKNDTKTIYYSQRLLKKIDESIGILNNKNNQKKLGLVVCRGSVSGRAIHFLLHKKIPKRAIVMSNHISLKDYVYLHNAGGIICEQGGINSHAAIFAREMGIPCIVGATDILSKIKDGQNIMLDANKNLIKTI